MKKFEFTLSALLKVRIKKEEIAQNNLWEAHQLLKKVTEELNSLIRESEDVKKQIGKVRNKTHKTETLVELFEYLSDVKRKIVMQEEIVKEAKFGVEVKRKEAISAMQQRKVIENIKEKKFKEWETEFNDQERKTFDEIATMHFDKGKTK